MLVGFKARNHPQQVAFWGSDDSVDTRITPRWLWEQLDREFGPFSLDAAADSHNAKCDRYFSIEDDGLSKPWGGVVWCNPPFSDLSRWVHKATTELFRCERIVMLVPANRTEQRWWHAYVEPYRDRDGSVLKVRFLPGRPEFGPAPTDGKGNRPPFGCALLIWEKR